MRARPRLPRSAGEFEATCEVTVVIRPKLSSLLFRNGTQATKAEFPLSPAFDPDVREYTIVTPDSVAELANYKIRSRGQRGRD